LTLGGGPSGGTVQMLSGNLNLTGGGSSAGTFNIASVSTVATGSPFTFNTGATATGAGGFTASAPVTIAGDTSFTNLRPFGDLSGAGNLTVNGQFFWGSGSMSGTGHTILNGTSSIGASTAVTLNGRTIDNSGTATLNTNLFAPLAFSGNAIWNNLAAGTLVLP